MAQWGVGSVHNINNLPDEILSHILSFLRTKDAVRTSSLSRRWRNLYTSVSTLDLELAPGPPGNAYMLMNFLDKVLLLRNGQSIVRFSLKCTNDSIDVLRIDGWIHTVLSHSVQELVLDLPEYIRCQVGMRVPHSLFTRETLVVLKLYLRVDYDHFEVPSEVCLPRLKVLHLHVAFPTDGSDERLFSSCPVLEELVLNGRRYTESQIKLTVSNPALKRLIIGYITIKRESLKRFDEGDDQVVINAPNLVYLSYSDTGFDSLVLADVHSLAEAVIDFYYHLECNTQVYAAAALDLFHGIQNIRSLQIGIHTILSLQERKIPMPWFGNLTRLKIVGLTNGWYKFDSLQSILACSGVLETLIIEELPHIWNANSKLVLTCLLFHLKTIEILTFRGEQAPVKIVEYFLINAKVLEKMTIHIKCKAREQLTRELLRLPRVSKECQIVLV